jgi:uncharacterized membrane protein
MAAAALAVMGLGISAYLIAAHYQNLSLACTTTGMIDCGSVTHSGYSTVAGVPVSLLGILWFAVMGVSAIFTVRVDAAVQWVTVQMVLALGGLGFVLYLVYAELVQLHRICEWCTGAHLLTLGILLLTVVRVQRG